MDVIICIDSYYAYEPNEKLDVDHIEENLKIIKEHLKTYSLSYIYGNNVTGDNILTYSKKLDIDGFLISSHALNIKDLKKMIKLVKSEGQEFSLFFVIITIERDESVKMRQIKEGDKLQVHCYKHDG